MVEHCALCTYVLENDPTFTRTYVILYHQLLYRPHRMLHTLFLESPRSQTAGTVSWANPPWPICARILVTQCSHAAPCGAVLAAACGRVPGARQGGRASPRFLCCIRHDDGSGDAQSVSVLVSVIYQDPNKVRSYHTLLLFYSNNLFMI